MEDHRHQGHLNFRRIAFGISRKMVEQKFLCRSDDDRGAGDHDHRPHHHPAADVDSDRWILTSKSG